MLSKNLTIIGATGFLSTTITRQLVNHGVNVRVIARNPDKAREALPDSVEIVKADVSDEQSLMSALEGTSTLYIHLNTETTDMDLPFYTEREGVANIVKAAKANRVEHIMQIAGIESLHEEFFQNGVIESRVIREAGMQFIKDSGIPYTFFYCSFFADSFVRLVENDSAYLFGELPHETYFTNSLQLADHINQAIQNPKALNQHYPVQGDEAISFPEAARRFFTNYDPKVALETLPIAVINELGLPASEAQFLQQVWEVSGGLKERFVSEKTYWDLGEPQRSIEEFASQLRLG
ncbi:SDR family oxidoreductase [Ferrimonas marina]|uniref:Uncharacterized conserved protein YbjT, contains NAD(P)-binding and DUF2867 domains n=1 Tax=Ferrimonas marina TaxID=299255 RepID=A0A1M5MRQ9_9GAMM|nr:NAD(P)H-binding protein [Ferrimonas marina]SHG79896.1 Uncharacterized conserved protein YbjT, contains NAD(P)-binding and DUF2867 domains [Ferrimonas marina]